MPYTEPWDDTTPPDSELANLLADNIRVLKVDIQERLASFGAGLLADRPTPEAVFGSATFGVTFYAYDTGQLFYWNSGAWVLVPGGSDKVYADSIVNAINAPGPTDANTITIPANSVSPGQVIRISTGFDSSTALSSNDLELLFAGTSIFTLPWVNAETGMITAIGNVLTGGAIAWQIIGTAANSSPITSAFVQSFDSTMATIVKSRITQTTGTGNSTGMMVQVSG